MATNIGYFDSFSILATRWSGTSAAFFVALLTLIFSFLGAILCAVLAGMMVGAARLPAWHTAVISLISPGVLFAMLRTSKADMSDAQVAILTAVCFSSFWLIYLMASALLRYEHKATKPASSSPMARANGRAEHRRPEKRINVPGVLNGAPNGALTLEALQGQWRCRGPERQEKVLSIQREQLELIVANGQGRVSFATRAEIRLDGHTSLQTLWLSSSQDPDTLVSI